MMARIDLRECDWACASLTLSFLVSRLAAVTYRELLTVLWDRHDPTTKDRQGGDVGTQYRSAYVHDFGGAPSP